MTDHWTFNDEKLAKDFSSYVKSQLPWYDLATKLVVQICENYLPVANGVLYDIGASDGNITRSMNCLLSNRKVETISLESSEQMCKQWHGYGEIIQCDAINHNYKNFDVAVCFLALMFLPVSELRDFIENLKAKCKSGGCIVFVEKFQAPKGYAGTVIRRMTLKQKMESGVTAQEIIEKELSLSGVQRPLSDSYKTESCFFKVGEFEGYIYEKP